MGCGRAGQAAPALEVVHPANGRDRVRGGLHRAGAHGGGQSGAPQDHPHLGEPGGPRAHPGQQAGPGFGLERRRGGEAALRPRTEQVHAESRAELQRGERPRAPAGPGETVRDDPEEEEDGEAQQEQEEVNSGLTLWTLPGEIYPLPGTLPGLMVPFNGRAISANKTTITRGRRVKRNGLAHNN